MRRRLARQAACGVVLASLLVCAAGCQDRAGGAANVTAGPQKVTAAGLRATGHDAQASEVSKTPEVSQASPASAKKDPPKARPEKPKPKQDPASTSTTLPGQKNPLAGCQQCHVDVEDEYMPTVHFQEKVACTDCHGPSKGHLADENNEVKPDQLFARKDVDHECERCHECERPAEPKRIPKSSPEYKVCTDCHGHHDLKLAGRQ